jgi:hypothetical protein
MASLPYFPPPGPAIAGTLDGAAGLALPTATGYAFQITGQPTWTLVRPGTPHLVLPDHDAFVQEGGRHGRP